MNQAEVNEIRDLYTQINRIERLLTTMQIFDDTLANIPLPYELHDTENEATMAIRNFQQALNNKYYALSQRLNELLPLDDSIGDIPF